MHPFHWIDWIVVSIPLLVVLIVGWKAQKHLKAVSDFTSGGRVAGRYVICVASGEAGLGLISVVGMWEMYYNSGFSVSFWGGFTALVGLFMNLLGYCTYRFRETRCLTIAQFFEVRYSRGVRFYSGVISAISGVINYAIFPAVGARFIMYFANLPHRFEVLGVGFNTYGVLLALCIGLAFAMVWFGGQLTIMCTDCTQGIFGFWMYVIIVVTVLTIMSWEQISDALISIPAPGKSLVDPFDNYELSNFNIYYVAIGVFGGILNRLSWQGSQGYNSSAKSAHEAKMAGILGSWRGQFGNMMIVLMAIVGFTYMNHVDFADSAAVINDALVTRIDNAAVISQMRVPMALSNLLPVGVTGLFFSSLILLMISTDNTYMHSWGTIIFQDCILPYTKKRFSPKTHLMGLRMAVLFVALFAWLFSYYFGQTTYILMFFAITGTIYLGGAGPCIVGGLYWKRGTTPGAYTALTAGWLFGGLGMALSQPAIWRDIARWLRDDMGATWVLPYMREFPINGQWMYFIAMLVALTLYIVVSLATCRKPFNMDRMLHRGKYSMAGEGSKAKLGWSIRSILGITDEFTRGDKILTWSVFLWSTFTWTLFICVVLHNVIFGFWTREGWMRYFFIMSFCVPAAIGIVSTVWFTIGGIWGLRDLFRRIGGLQRNDLDDGRVIGNVSAADLAHTTATSGRTVVDMEPDADAGAEAAREMAAELGPVKAPERMSWLFVVSAVMVVGAVFLPWIKLPTKDSLDRPPEVAGKAVYDMVLLQAAEATLAGSVGPLAEGLAVFAAAGPDDEGAAKDTAPKEKESAPGQYVMGASLPLMTNLPGTLDLAVERKRILQLDDTADGLRGDEAKALTELGKKLRVLHAAQRKVAALGLAWEVEDTVYADGGVPEYGKEAVAFAGGRLAPELEKEWREAHLRLEHAVRDVAGNRDHQDRLDRKLRALIASYHEHLAAFGDGGGLFSRTMPMSSGLLFVGPLLALIGLVLHFLGKPVPAGRFGLAAALATGAVLFFAMLNYSELINSFLHVGVLVEALGAYLLLASSTVTLTAIQDAGAPPVVVEPEASCPA